MHDTLRYILGLHRLIADNKPLKEQIGLARIANDPDGRLSMLAPVFFNNNFLSKRKREATTAHITRKNFSISTVSLIGPHGGDVRFRMEWNIPQNSLILEDPQPLIAGHQIKHIAEFDYSKVAKLQEFVKEKAAVTFVMENTDCASVFLKRIHKFKTGYPYTTFFGHRGRGNSGPLRSRNTQDDILNTCVTILDLGMALPVYNPKRDYGMCVLLNTYWPKSSDEVGELYFCSTMAFGVNKYEDNLTYMDGSSLRKPGWFADDYIEHWLNILKGEKERRTHGVKPTPAEPKHDAVKKERDWEGLKEEMDKLEEIMPAPPSRPKKKKKSSMEVNSSTRWRTTFSGNYYVMDSSSSSTSPWQGGNPCVEL